MKILIDARMYGLEHAGIGRYIEQLVNQLILLDGNNDYVILLRKKYFDLLQLPKKWKKILADIPHYSLSEQVKLPQILYKEKADLVHFPHFNIPIFYFGKFVITIHDLIKHTSKGKETTTRDPWFYWLKYFGYKLVFSQAVKRAVKIIVPSKFVRDDLAKEYGLSVDKIIFTYEGVSEEFQKTKIDKSKVESILNKYEITEPYFIYTGSVYPHKNIDRLIEAFKNINETRKVFLTIVCSRNVFWEKLKKKITDNNMDSYVKMLGFVSDEELKGLYEKSQGLVFPTLSEGFGLPGLEAMTSGTIVVCSQIPVLEEIYGSAAIYFNPLNISDMASKINQCLDINKEEREKIIDIGTTQAKKYSWEKMAKETIAIYESFKS
jgi:glycosyltransferase involved in cell wall biosynthesis